MKMNLPALSAHEALLVVSLSQRRHNVAFNELSTAMATHSKQFLVVLSAVEAVFVHVKATGDESLVTNWNQSEETWKTPWNEEQFFHICMHNTHNLAGSRLSSNSTFFSQTIKLKNVGKWFNFAGKLVAAIGRWQNHKDEHFKLVGTFSNWMSRSGASRVSNEYSHR